MVYFHTKFRISNSNNPIAITIKPKGKPSRGRHNVFKKTEQRMHTFKNYYQKSWEYGLRSRYSDWAAIIPVWANIFSSPKRADRL
jgi:hypothetical protein